MIQATHPPLRSSQAWGIWLFGVFVALNLWVLALTDQVPLSVRTWLFALFLVTCFGLVRSFSRQKLTPDVFVWSFTYLFFVLAPLFQMANTSYFPNGLPTTHPAIVPAIQLVIIWSVAFSVARHSGTAVTRAAEPLDVGPELVRAYTVASGILIPVGLVVLGWGFVLGTKTLYTMFSGIAVPVMLGTLLYSLPFATLLYGWMLRGRGGALSSRLGRRAMLTGGIAMLLFASPLNAPRFVTGTFIITLIILNFRRVTAAWGFVAVLGGFAVVFPFLDQFRRRGYQGDVQVDVVDGMLVQLTELHFDTFSNLVGVLDFVGVHGHLLGRQLLGVLLFWMPRGLWAGKPVDTGDVVVEHLASVTGTRVLNVGVPLVGEAYIDFGLVGVILAAVLLAQVVNRLERGATMEARVAMALLAGSIMYLLRGSLMAGFSSFTGLLVFVVGPLLLARKDGGSDNASAQAQSQAPRLLGYGV